MKAFDEEEYYRERDDRDNYEEYSTERINPLTVAKSLFGTIGIFIGVNVVIAIVGVIVWLNNNAKQRMASQEQTAEARNELAYEGARDLQKWIDNIDPELIVVPGSVTAYTEGSYHSDYFLRVLRCKVKRGETEFEAIYDIDNMVLFTKERKQEFTDAYSEWLRECLLFGMTEDDISVTAEYADCLSEKARFPEYYIDDKGNKTVRNKPFDTDKVGFNATMSGEEFSKKLSEGYFYNNICTAKVVLKDVAHLTDLKLLFTGNEKSDVPSVSLFRLYLYLNDGSVIELYTGDYCEMYVFRVVKDYSSGHRLVVEEWAIDNDKSTPEAREYKLMKSDRYEYEYDVAGKLVHK